MNWLLIAVIGILAVFAIKGHRDGFIKTIFSIFTIFLALLLAVFAGPFVSRTLQKNESLMNGVTKQISKAFAFEEGKTDKKSSKPTVKEKDKISQEKIIRELRLPSAITKSLLENNNSEAYKAMAVKSFTDYVSRYLAIIILNAAAFILVFVISIILLYLLARVLDLISRLPIINGLNKTAGLLVGILNGLIIIWILCIFLTVFSTTGIGKSLYVYINDSWILSSIYNNNLLMRSVMDIAKVLF